MKGDRVMYHPDASKNISVSIVPPATKYRPLDNRQYYLHYVEGTQEYHLLITGSGEYEVQQNGTVLLSGEWRYCMGQYILVLTVNLNNLSLGHHSTNPVAHNDFLKKHLENLIQVVVQGDAAFYKYFPWLLDTKINLQMDQNESLRKEFIYTGRPRNYMQKQNEMITIS